jgi:uncharacterized protein YgbK (DUF1537 family)
MPSPPSDRPILVLSGSRSPSTAAQIEAAKFYEKIEVAAQDLAYDAPGMKEVMQRSAALLGAGRNVLVSVAAAANSAITGREISRALAKLASCLVGRVRLRSLVVAGGDTSSAIVSGLNVDSLEFVRDIDTGVSLVRASGGGSGDGLQIVLKGGQMGAREFFDRL